MPALIQPGAEVRPYAAGDGTTQIPCPACTHYIPNVAHDALTVGEQRPTAAFIRCACPQGQGTNITGRRVTCPCHAVFRLHPQGMQRYVVAEGWQEVPLSITYDDRSTIIAYDGECAVSVDFVDPAPAEAVPPSPPVAPVKRRRRK